MLNELFNIFFRQYVGSIMSRKVHPLFLPSEHGTNSC